MTHEPINDMDILAYADGRLDRDPSRRRRVERHLAENPEAAARVEAFRAQDDAIRRAYPLPDGDDPSADHLADLVLRNRRPSTGPTGTPWRHAATVALMIASGLVGWVAASDEDATNPHLLAFRSGELLDALRPAAGLAPAEQDEVAPILDGAGFTLTSSRMITRNGNLLRQFTFENDAGRIVRVFRQRRGQENMPAIPVMEKDGSSLAIWEDGPYAYGLLTTANAATARHLADMARRSIRDASDGIAVTGPLNALPPSFLDPSTADPSVQHPQPATTGAHAPTVSGG